MTVRELIVQLMDCNMEAEVTALVHNREESVSLCWGGGCDGDGGKRHAPSVNIHVDRLCQSERSVPTGSGKENADA